MASTEVNAASVVALANQMDELSHRAQDVLARYEAAVEHAQSAQILNGQAGSANLLTGAEIKDAQMKIQARFQAVNDLLRTGATTYTSTDESNAHAVSSVAGGLRFT